MGDISREEHAEFMARMQAEHQRQDDENKRQNKRLDVIEQRLSELNIEKLALSIEVLSRELTRLRTQLETLEKRDGETWRQIKYYIFTAVIGLIFGFLVKGAN